VVVGVDGKSYDLGPGDTIHFEASRPHFYTNLSRETSAAILWMASRRDIS
jgi:quercetin dioxygenase-like cupin family protein